MCDGVSYTNSAMFVPPELLIRSKELSAPDGSPRG
jgi:hypothetical protein